MAKKPVIPDDLPPPPKAEEAQVPAILLNLPGPMFEQGTSIIREADLPWPAPDAPAP